MSGIASRTRLRRSSTARRQRSITPYLVGGLVLVALYVAGNGVVWLPVQNRQPSSAPMGQTNPYRQIPTLLAHARAHYPALNLPHARWFIRVRHGHVQIVVVDHAALQREGGALIGTGKGP